MACRTPSVKRVADKTTDAKLQLDKLEKMINDQYEVNLADFDAKIKNSLVAANINDAEQISENHAIKTEYSSEFSIDAIAGVVTSSLKALNAATNPDDPRAYASPEAIDAYVDVVNKVAEAAKSSAKSAASLSYSMNRLGPGLFSFIYARSASLTEKETFGTETVCTTALYYRYVRSEHSLQNDAKFEAAKMLMDAAVKAIAGWIRMQASILEDFSNSQMTEDEYITKDDFYQKRIEFERAKMEHPEGIAAKSRLRISSPAQHGSKETEALVGNLLLKLASKKDSKYNKIIAKQEARLSQGHYLHN